ncbi:NUMOD4 motif-containing HNH endonuclease, partial [Alphaproteobacteria bacterium]|nr:NUMOD4 motif-containing HNH endonuclease [Alphaproteobacteria bacterium]
MVIHKEKWKFISHTNNSYQISNLGNVKGKKNQLLKPTLMKIGYYKTALSLEEKTVKQKYVHHLVAEEFLNFSIKNKGLVINHKNGNKLDNRLVNLEIVNRKENASHWAKKNKSNEAGRKRTGFCGRGHKLKNNQYHCNECRKIIKKYGKFIPPKELKWKQSSIEGYLISDTGKIWSNKTQRIIKSGVNIPGYEYVNLRVNSKSKNYAVSRLVYETFSKPIPKHFVVDHINENKLDNRIQNLRIMSKKENSLFSKNSMRKRKKHGFKLKEEQVAEIKWLLK